MSIFKKKEEAEEIPETFEERKITRKLKDLNPENKKKRKELPKPWGKKERILILVVFLITTVVSIILLIGSSVHFEGHKFSFKLPKISLDSINIFKGETIVVEKK